MSSVNVGGRQKNPSSFVDNFSDDNNPNIQFKGFIKLLDLSTNNKYSIKKFNYGSTTSSTTNSASSKSSN